MIVRTVATIGLIAASLVAFGGIHPAAAAKMGRSINNPAVTQATPPGVPQIGSPTTPAPRSPAAPQAGVINTPSNLNGNVLFNRSATGSSNALVR